MTGTGTQGRAASQPEPPERVPGPAETLPFAANGT